MLWAADTNEPGVRGHKGRNFLRIGSDNHGQWAWPEALGEIKEELLLSFG